MEIQNTLEISIQQQFIERLIIFMKLIFKNVFLEMGMILFMDFIRSPYIFQSLVCSRVFIK